MNAPNQRRLAAIASADMVGYSRLMGIDEVGTLAALRAHRSEFVDPKIAEYGGRIVKTMGDGLLLEFPSVVDATACAIEVQKGMAARNEGVDEDRHITFRIGVHVGDIIIDGEDILGDGVNIAARVEALAEPGGIEVTGRVHDDVRDRLEADFADTGEHDLKNIARPVRVWRWSPEARAAVGKAPPEPDETLALPDRPSIVVLPFGGSSGDADQEFLADGLDEDITTMLSNLRWMFVIARNSAFTYKNQAVNIARVGQELGVRYVLEGSVRKAGNRVRVNAQLVEAASGTHLWADKYDRQMDDIFAIQDDITKSIVGMLETEIANAEQVASMRRPANLDAWTAYHRGMSLLGKNYVSEDLKQSLEHFSKAVELDPTFAAAHAGLSVAQLLNLGWGGGDHDEANETRRSFLENARQAVRLDERDPWCLAALARAQLYNFDLKSAQRTAEQALNLSPNSFQSLWAAAIIFGLTGDSGRAFDLIDEVQRVSPRSPFSRVLGPVMRSIAHLYLAKASGDATDYRAVIDHSEQAMEETPGVWPRLIRCVALHHLGQNEQAATALEAVHSGFPNFSAESIRRLSFFPDPDISGWFLETLLTVGLRD